MTGGGTGIGKMIAKAFVAVGLVTTILIVVGSHSISQNGARVYIASRKITVCSSVAEELSSMGPGICYALTADLGSEDGCTSFAASIAAREDKVHVLVNNSGAVWGAPMDEYPDKAWDKLWALNVKAIFFLTRSLLKQLDAASTPTDPGRVINVGSIAGLFPQAVSTFAYDASKAAVHMLTKKLSRELADRREEGGQRITVRQGSGANEPWNGSGRVSHYITPFHVLAIFCGTHTAFSSPLFLLQPLQAVLFMRSPLLSPFNYCCTG